MKTVCFCHRLQLHLAFVDSIFPAYHSTFKMKTNAEITRKWNVYVLGPLGKPESWSSFKKDGERIAKA